MRACNAGLRPAGPPASPPAFARQSTAAGRRPADRPVWRPALLALRRRRCGATKDPSPVDLGMQDRLQPVR